MNTNSAKQFKQVSSSHISRLPKRYRMSQEDRDALYREGEKRYRAPFIRRGERDRAIYAVGFYLWCEGYGPGRHEERLELLIEWFLERRTARRESERQAWIEAITRAVYWKPRDWVDMEKFSEALIERFMQVPNETPESFFYGNLKSWNKASSSIAGAKRRLEERGERVGVNALARESGCDHKTVAKHKHEWSTDRFSSMGTVVTPTGVWGEQKKEAVQDLNLDNEKDAFGTDMVTDNPGASLSASAIISTSEGGTNATTIDSLDAVRRQSGAAKKLEGCSRFESEERERKRISATAKDPAGSSARVVQMPAGSQGTDGRVLSQALDAESAQRCKVQEARLEQSESDALAEIRVNRLRR